MLTPRQQDVLNFLTEQSREEGFMPSTREIKERFGFASQTAAVNHLRALERKGAIRRLPGKARAVTLGRSAGRGSVIDVPIFGAIPAGMAVLVEQENEGWVSLNAESAGVSPRAQVFALKVRGDSMNGAHILDGDLVVLELREPRDGDIVAALIDGETTLKRFVKKRGRPFLRAENPAYPDLLPAAELVVQGVMVTLVRRC